MNKKKQLCRTMKKIALTTSSSSSSPSPSHLSSYNPSIIHITKLSPHTTSLFTPSYSSPHSEDIKERAASACRNNKPDLLEDFFQLQHFSVDSEVDEFGNKLLHIACQNGNKNIAKLLLRNGASINSQNSTGQTPLHFCFAYKYRDLGEYLRTKGADDRILNKDGLTCYEGMDSRTLSLL